MANADHTEVVQELIEAIETDDGDKQGDASGALTLLIDGDQIGGAAATYITRAIETDDDTDALKWLRMALQKMY